MSTFYKKLYTRHIKDSSTPNQGVGGMDEKFVADFQLGMLRSAGLKPADNVYEVGAGTGRLLEALIPFLSTDSKSKYFGIEIVPNLVEIANKRISTLWSGDSNRFRVAQVKDNETPVSDRPDFICAFSVFTHMEAEDIVLKLIELRTISHSNTIGLFTFLPLEHVFGRACFLGEMKLNPEVRFDQVRNVAFTRDMAISLAQIAGWEIIGDQWAELDEPFENGYPRTNQSWLIVKPDPNIPM
jgi:SAM-dependent methyltransferase